jgi:tetratricopeptide (TPR) repeat protein
MPDPGKTGRLAAAAVLATAAVALAVMAWRWAAERAERQQGLELAAGRDFAAAEPLLLRAYQRNPDDREVVQALAVAQPALGKMLSQAEPILTRWCELEPDRPEPLKARLDLWLRLSNHERALADAREILRLEPANRAVRNTLIWLLIGAERFDEAQELCQSALRSEPANADLRMLLAQTHEAKGEGTKADELLDGLLAADPRDADALLLRGLRCSAAQEHDKGIPLLRKALVETHDPGKRQTARYHLSRALALTGQHDEAQRVLAEWERSETLQRLLSDSMQQPDNVPLRLKAAAALLDSEQATQGVELLERLLARAPHHQEAHRLLARHYERQGLPAQAAEHRRRAE